MQPNNSSEKLPLSNPFHEDHLSDNETEKNSSQLQVRSEFSHAVSISNKISYSQDYGTTLPPLSQILDSIKDSKLKARFKKFLDLFGFFDTSLAMSPQGLLAFLQTDAIIQSDRNLGLTHLSFEERIAFDSAFGISAALGKIFLIRFYNKEAFIGLANFELKSLLPKSTTPADIIGHTINSVLSVNISTFFMLLTIVAFRDSVTYLKPYNSQFAKIVSGALKKTWLQWIFAVSSFSTNLIANPTINRIFYGMILDTLEYPLIHPAFRYQHMHHQTKLEESARRVILQAQHHAKYAQFDNDDDINDFINRFMANGFNIDRELRTVLNNTNVSEYVKKLLVEHLDFSSNTEAPTRAAHLTTNNQKIACLLLVSLTQPTLMREHLLLSQLKSSGASTPIQWNTTWSNYLMQSELWDSWAEFIVSNGVALTALNFSLAGLFNFVALTQVGYDALEQEIHHDFAGDKISLVTGPLSFISIGGIACISVYPLMRGLTNTYVYPLLKYAALAISGHYQTLKDCGFRKNSTPTLLRRIELIIMLVAIGYVCGTGGLTNVYQAAVAGENVFMAICAEIASSLIEADGFWMLALASLEGARKEDLSYINPFNYGYHLLRGLDWTLHLGPRLIDWLFRTNIAEKPFADNNHDAAALFLELRNSLGRFGALNENAIGGDLFTLMRTDTIDKPASLEPTQIILEETPIDDESLLPDQPTQLPAKHWGLVESVIKSTPFKAASRFYNNFSIWQWDYVDNKSSAESLDEDQPLLRGGSILSMEK